MRLKSKTTATLLIAIFMISAFAFAVSASPGYFLTTNNGGISEWSTVRSLSGSRSIKLYVPITNQAEYDIGQYDEARVVFSYGNNLDSIDSISYNSYVVSGMAGTQHPYVTMAVDSGDDGPDAWVVQLVVPAFAVGNWGLTTVTDASLVHVAGGTQPSTPPPLGQGGSWTNQDPAKATTTGQTLGNLKNTNFAGFTVVEVKVMNGEIVFTEPVISFVDDVTINDVLYDFESETGSSIEGYGRYPLLGIQVDPTSVDFGIIVAGHSSGTETVTVTNIGEETITVTATFENEDPSSFYTDNLKLDGYSIADWNQKTTAHTIVVDADLPVDLVLSVPSIGPVGVYTGTLVFEITPPPPQ